MTKFCPMHPTTQLYIDNQPKQRHYLKSHQLQELIANRSTKKVYPVNVKTIYNEK